MKKSKRKIAVIDFETDPFLHGRLPVPFSWGFYDGERYVKHWQEKAWESPKACAKVLIEFLQDTTEPYLIFAHNGGKFDFLFFIEELTGSLKIVNGRILQATMGIHTLRDSYAILPIPLKALGDKFDIDYMLMERDVREDHKEEIEKYLEQDCIALYNAVLAFFDEFGDNLTIGGTAMKQLKKFHSFDAGNAFFDEQFRKYYYGGRCQCFETGVIDMAVKGYDINSSYPDTMLRMKHPTSTDYIVSRAIRPNTAFITWEGLNHNAVPARTKTGLDFTIPEGTFHTSIHEFNVALDNGMIEPKKIIECVEFTRMTVFDDFINHFYDKRLEAKAGGFLFLYMFYKLILNSSYGKFAQSPDNFKDSIILPTGEIADEPYLPEFEHGEYTIWSKPSNQKTYFNVATAASITGGARANLLAGITNAHRPIYCDTDSILCESLSANIDSKKLGAWKLEFEGDQIAVAGKKMYAVMGKDDNGETVCLKKASKGTILSPLSIFMLARGDTVETKNDAPTFKLDGRHTFIKRNIKRTGIISYEI